MTRRLPILLLALAAACAPKAEDVSSTSGAASVADSLRVDSLRADSLRRDSLRADSLRTRGDTVPSVSAKAPPPRILGRDSAFGPTHTIDAKGKVTPIKKP